MAQQGLIGVHKKLYTLEHLLPSPDPAQFAETAKSAALLSERSTASLRGFLFTTTGGMPEGYYQQAAAAQGIKVSATDDYVFVRVPALLPKKKAAEGFKFLVVPLQAAFEEYHRQHALPHFSDCVICIEHIYDRCLPITAVRDYDNLEFKSILDVIALYCMKDDTGALCDLYHTSCWRIPKAPRKNISCSVRATSISILLPMTTTAKHCSGCSVTRMRLSSFMRFFCSLSAHPQKILPLKMMP